MTAHRGSLRALVGPFTQGRGPSVGPLHRAIALAGPFGQIGPYGLVMLTSGRYKGRTTAHIPFGFDIAGPLERWLASEPPPERRRRCAYGGAPGRVQKAGRSPEPFAGERFPRDHAAAGAPEQVLPSQLNGTRPARVHCGLG